MSNPFQTRIVITQDGGIWHVEWTYDDHRCTKVCTSFEEVSRFVEGDLL